MIRNDTKVIRKRQPSLSTKTNCAGLAPAGAHSVLGDGRPERSCVDVAARQQARRHCSQVGTSVPTGSARVHQQVGTVVAGSARGFRVGDHGLERAAQHLRSAQGKSYPATNRILWTSDMAALC